MMPRAAHSALAEIVERWGPSKRAAERFLDLSADGIHAMVGVLMLLALAVLTGRRLDDARLWLAVLGIELVNEAIDMSAPGGAEAYWVYSLHDLIVTMAVPTAILLLLRHTDRRVAQPQAVASAEATSEENSARPSLDE